MIAIAFLFIRMLCDCFKSRRQVEAENLVLRHQLNVLQQRAPRRLHLRWADRALFIWLYRRCPRILNAITIVRPETVLRWHRMGSTPSTCDAFLRNTRPIIMTCGRTFRLGRTRLVDGRSSASGTLLRIRSLADYTINTLGSSFRNEMKGTGYLQT